jgi:translocation and assembly module TamA
MATAYASPALAFDLFGLKLFEDQSEIDADAVIADPQPYTVDFSSPNAPDDVAAAARNASSLVADAGQPASGAAGLLATARGDYQRIVAALYQEGYYGGTVNILVGGREAATLAPDVNLPDPVAVSIIVDPGPLFRFNRVAIANATPATSDPNDRVETPQSQGYGAGLVAKSTVILRAETLALDAWRQQGYPKARIAKRDVVADHPTSTVDVTITVDPGRHADIGDVAVQGTENMDPEFVRRQTGLTVGEEYDPDTLAKAQKRLSRLEVFRALRIEQASAIGSDGLLPFTVIVQEQPLRRFGAGATISSIDGAGIEGYWMHRNLFGQAERLRLDAKLAGIGYQLDTAEFDYAFGGTFTKPGVFTPDTDFVASVAAERTTLTTYTETSASARAGFTHQLNDQISFDGAVAIERSFFEDDFGTRDFTTFGLPLGATFDNRDSTTDPTRGFYVNGTLEPFYELNYANTAVRSTIEARTYFGFGENSDYVLAGRVKAGALIGPELAEIPPDRLFFAGGGGSVRGYGYKSIGVTGPDGIVTGGRYLLEGSLEARAKVTDDIGVVAFLDGGYVAADTFPSIDELRVGAGVGLRYYTGLGPLRLDVAVPLNKRIEDPDYALYVGIGQSF